MFIFDVYTFNNNFLFESEQYIIGLCDINNKTLAFIVVVIRIYGVKILTHLTPQYVLFFKIYKWLFFNKNIWGYLPYVILILIIKVYPV